MKLQLKKESVRNLTVENMIRIKGGRKIGPYSLGAPTLGSLPIPHCPCCAIPDTD